MSSGSGRNARYWDTALSNEDSSESELEPRAGDGAGIGWEISSSSSVQSEDEVELVSVKSSFMSNKTDSAPDPLTTRHNPGVANHEPLGPKAHKIIVTGAPDSPRGSDHIDANVNGRPWETSTLVSDAIENSTANWNVSSFNLKRNITPETAGSNERFDVIDLESDESDDSEIESLLISYTNRPRSPSEALINVPILLPYEAISGSKRVNAHECHPPNVSQSHGSFNEWQQGCSNSTRQEVNGGYPLTRLIDDQIEEADAIYEPFGCCSESMPPGDEPTRLLFVDNTPSGIHEVRLTEANQVGNMTQPLGSSANAQSNDDVIRVSEDKIDDALNNSPQKAFEATECNKSDTAESSFGRTGTPQSFVGVNVYRCKTVNLQMDLRTTSKDQSTVDQHGTIVGQSLSSANQQPKEPFEISPFLRSIDVEVEISRIYHEISEAFLAREQYFHTAEMMSKSLTRVEGGITEEVERIGAIEKKIQEFNSLIFAHNELCHKINLEIIRRKVRNIVDGKLDSPLFDMTVCPSKINFSSRDLLHQSETIEPPSSSSVEIQMSNHHDDESTIQQNETEKNESRSQPLGLLDSKKVVLQPQVGSLMDLTGGINNEVKIPDSFEVHDSRNQSTELGRFNYIAVEKDSSEPTSLPVNEASPLGQEEANTIYLDIHSLSLVSPAASRKKKKNPRNPHAKISKT